MFCIPFLENRTESLPLTLYGFQNGHNGPSGSFDATPGT